MNMTAILSLVRICLIWLLVAMWIGYPQPPPEAVVVLDEVVDDVAVEVVEVVDDVGVLVVLDGASNPYSLPIVFVNT
jgi:hypothetical protein